MDKQTVADVLMIRPVCFAGNPQTAESNHFQQSDAGSSTASIQELALAEFDGLVGALTHAGVRVHVFVDTPKPHTPDSIFPNNWVSFHADGSVVLYPMMAPNRREERRLDLIEALDLQHGFRVERTVDLTHREAESKFLEGTGSLVLDRRNRIAYACLSLRTDMDVLGEFAQRLDYEIVAFEAVDGSGVPIYHTNVLMSLGDKFAAVCSESIEAGRRAPVLGALRSGGRAVVELTFAQMHQFAGNMLELRTRSGGSIVAMSAAAHASLTPGQIAVLESEAGPIVASPIPVIERIGGGSVRCMLAEVALPRR